MLTARELAVRYRQSLLGVGWAILLPLAMMLVFTFVFTSAVAAPAFDGMSIPYPLYAFAGLVPWAFFAGSLNSSVNSLVANRNLVTKVYFPREVFPLSCVASSLVDFAIGLVVLAGLMAYFAAVGRFTLPSPIGFLALPLVTCVQIVLTTALGLLLAMANLYFRDVRQAFQVGIQLLMFVSAVVVPIPPSGGLVAGVLRYNPIAVLMQAYRDCLLAGQWPELSGLFAVGAFGLVLLIVCWRWFRRASGQFAELI